MENKLKKKQIMFLISFISIICYFLFTGGTCEIAEPIEDLGNLFNYKLEPNIVNITQTDTGFVKVTASDLYGKKIKLELIDNTIAPFIVNELQYSFVPDTISDITSSILSIFIPENVQPLTYDVLVKFNIMGGSSGEYETAELRIVVQKLSSDFSLSLSTSQISILPGGDSETVNVNVDRIGGHSETINLSIENAPTGVSYTFVPNQIPGDQNSSQLTINVDNSVVPNNYSLIVKGDDGNKQKSAGLQLTVGTPTNPWFQLTSGVMENLVGASFSDTQNGYVVGNNGTILKTTNGGTTWDALNPPPLVHFKAIQFFDVLSGYVIGTENSIYYTSDGGMNWSNKSVAGITTDQNDLHFLSQQKGWVVGRYIHYTINGGSSWDLQLDYDPPRIWNNISFANNNNGIVVGDKSGLGKIFYTTNAGVNWSESSYPSAIQNLYSVCFTNANTAYAVGRNGTLLKSTNSGQSWIQITNTTSGTLWGVIFVDEQNGWIVGNKIWRTFDGGTNWIEEDDPPNTLYKAFFLNSKTGYAVGSSGLIMKRE